MERAWWKEAAVYQIYPRSFLDSNGDGIGDINGITMRLDYLKALGVDVIWLSPVYESPDCDNGYDISDYRAIMKKFGTMEDFDRLLAEAHRRGLKIVMDLVVNHTSDEHRWFIESRASRDNPYRDYYIWRPGRGGDAPNNWGSIFGGSAWEYDEETEMYYLHLFAKGQPDLNWENPKVRQEVYDILRFWLDKGIDGFRMDVISLLSKDQNFPDGPVIQNKAYGSYYAGCANGPRVHEFLQEMNREVLSKYDIMTVGEGSAVTYKEVEKFVGPERQELDMLYGFGPSEVRNYTTADCPDSGIGYSLIALKKMFSGWDKAVGKGWPAIYLGNHDQPRMLSRFGDDRPQFRVYAAKMLATFLLTMRGTPYWLAGDEIGMCNPKFDRIGDYRDIATLNQYKQIEKRKGDTQWFLQMQQQTSRDNARTPFQWDNSGQAGFTTGMPWIGVNPDYRKINVAAQEKDPWSVLNYFRQLIALRKSSPDLVYAGYTLLDAKNPRTYTYLRKGEKYHYLVVLNFSSKQAEAYPGIDMQGAEILMCNYGDLPQLDKVVSLRPYEAVVMRSEEFGG